jgi:5-formyltetrahydrofolate cyclo-ligase
LTPHQRKLELRKVLRASRDQRPAEERESRSRRACQNLLSFLEPDSLANGPVALIALYAAARSEASPAWLETGASSEAQFAYPRIVGNAMVFCRAQRADLIDSKRFSGFREPRADAPTVDPSTLRVIVVPGLGFGRDGSRMGYGGGYYDRFLSDLRESEAEPKALVVGFGFELQVFDSLPVEPHDQRVDLLATDSGIIDCRSWD